MRARVVLAVLAAAALVLLASILGRAHDLARIGHATGILPALPPIYLDSGNEMGGSVVQRSGHGVLMFAYGQNTTILARYVREAAFSARMLKAANPTLRVALATNLPNVSKEFTEFDVVVPIRFDHAFGGGYKIPKEGSKDGSFVVKRRQWLTRILYMAHSPFELTLALDSQVVPCSDQVDAILAREARADPWYDIAYNTQQRSGKPHCWAILYRATEATRALLRDWFVHQVNRDAMGEDQSTLNDVVGRAVRAGALRRGRLHANFASAFVPVSAEQRHFHPRTTQLLTSRVHLFHMLVHNESQARTVCARVNAAPERRRVVVQPKGSRHAHLMKKEWRSVFSAAEFKNVTEWEPPEAPNEIVFGCDAPRDQLPFVYPWESHTRCRLSRSFF